MVLCASPEKPRLVVLDLQPGAGVDGSLTGPLADAITAEVQRVGFFEVLSSRDLQALLGLERQKQLLGCGDDAASRTCMAELTDALGARFVLSGSLARLGDAYQLTLNTLDTQKAQPLGRATRLARSLEALRGLLPWAVAEATGTPLPAPPSRALSYTLIGVGGAGALFGLVWGGLALSQEQQLAARLATARDTPGLLDSRASYVTEAQGLERDRWIGVGALVVGTAALVTGLVVLPADGSSVKLAVVPAGAGLGLAGVFP